MRTLQLKPFIYVLALFLSIGCGPERLSQEDILTLVVNNAWHGTKDDTQSILQLSTRVLNADRIEVTCGSVSAVTVQLLREQGYDARVVSTITLDAWDGVDDGHTLIETKMGSHWVAFDMTSKVQILVNNQPASLYTVVNNLNNLSLRRLGNPRIPVVSPEFINDYPDLAWIFTSTLQWYRRILQVEMIENNTSKFMFYDTRDILRLTNYSPAYIWQTENSFLNTFYPGGSF